jgi:AcrR family transcriptional regulator
MPRHADHEQRRRQIAEAVWRIAARTGLEGVTVRQVADEAGVPARLLQYYFGTRAQLLIGALTILNADAETRARERIEALGDDPGPRAVVRGILLELLPLDEERRARHLVHAAYFVRFLADAELGALVKDTPPALEALVAGLVRQQAGDAVDADAEAAFLVAGVGGLQGQMLLGQLDETAALTLVDHQLDRLFTPST